MARTPERRASRGRRFQYYQSGDVSNILTAANLEVLAHITYDEGDIILRTDVPFEVTLDSLFIGGQWSWSSGGFEIYATEHASNINYLMPTMGIKDQSIPANQDMTGLMPLGLPVPVSPLLEAQFQGAAAASGSTTMADDFIILGDGAFYAVEFITEEQILATDYLQYDVHLGINADTKPIYSHKKRSGVQYEAGDLVKIWFDHPLNARLDDRIFQIVYLRKGDAFADPVFLQVRPIASDPEQHWVNVVYRATVDKDIAFKSDIDMILVGNDCLLMIDNNGNVMINEE